MTTLMQPRYVVAYAKSDFKKQTEVFDHKSAARIRFQGVQKEGAVWASVSEYWTGGDKDFWMKK